MTAVAAPRAVEIRLAGFRIADQDVEDLVGAAIGVEINRGMQKSGEIHHLRLGQVELRHAAVRPPDAEKGAELLTAFILLHDDRARQIGAARPAARIRAMAEAALLDEQGSAALDRGLIG